MREGQVVSATKSPATVESMLSDLRILGVQPGATVLVHSSLTSIGWVSGGAVAVIRALAAAVGENGTLVMPTHSTDLTEPAKWSAPPVPESWWETIRTTAPAYDPDLTPTRGMGKIPECFRKMKDALRSSHPHSSFCAYGAEAERVTDNHELAFGLGEGSPLARIYDMGGYVLLLGVGHGNNTSLHLSEHRAQLREKKIIHEGAPVLVSGMRKWVTFEDLEADDSDFPQIGSDYNKTAGDEVRSGKVGLADCQLMPQRGLVDFGIRWMQQHRK